MDSSSKQAENKSKDAVSAPTPEQLEKNKKIVEGFQINWMNMRDANTGKIVWESPAQDWQEAFSKELQVEIPKEVLKLSAVSREMNFSSKEAINNFRLVQVVALHGRPIEEWKFDFGFVIPGSTNSWQCVIESAGEGQMLPVPMLSGNLTIETKFFDGDYLVSTTRLRIFYV